MKLRLNLIHAYDAVLDFHVVILRRNMPLSHLRVFFCETVSYLLNLDERQIQSKNVNRWNLCFLFSWTYMHSVVCTCIIIRWKVCGGWIRRCTRITIYYWIQPEAFMLLVWIRLYSLHGDVPCWKNWFYWVSILIYVVIFQFPFLFCHFLLTPLTYFDHDITFLIFNMWRWTWSQHYTDHLQINVLLVFRVTVFQHFTLDLSIKSTLILRISLL